MADYPYISGFCAVGAHEGAKKLSPGGTLFRPCPGAYFYMGGGGECKCDCHTAFKQIRELMASMQVNTGSDDLSDRPRDGGTPDPTHTPVPVTSSVSVEPSPFAHTNAGLTIPPPRPSVITGGKSFKATPSGRAAKGELEEKVRVQLAKVCSANADMVAMTGLTPKVLSVAIDDDKPPSQGAIHAILIRWEQKGLVELGTKPFRFLKFTDLGRRQLMY